MLSLQLITPYAGIAVAILLLAVALRFSALPELPAEPAPARGLAVAAWPLRRCDRGSERAGGGMKERGSPLFLERRSYRQRPTTLVCPC